MLAALFGALWLFTAVPAQAQQTTTPLSATLNVKNLGGNNGHGCWNGSAVVSVRCSTTATLSDDDFTYGGTDYAFTAILSISGQVRIQLDKAVPQGLRAATLNIGSFVLALSNANVTGSGTILTWHGSYSQLSLGSTISVSLVSPSPPPTVSLSASPNPVTEGSSVTVTATLSEALSNSVDIPLTITDNTAESGDHGTLASITIAANAISGTGTITTKQDGDTEDETFTVSLGRLPSSVTAGSRDSVTVTITDQTRILPWSSMLTVKQHGHLRGCNITNLIDNIGDDGKVTGKNWTRTSCSSNPPDPSSDALTEDTLTYNDVSYRIIRLTSEGGIPPHKQIVLGFDKPVPDEMIGVLCLRVDGSPLCLRDARDQNKIIITEGSGVLHKVFNLYVFGWQKTPIGWTEGQQVVSLGFSDDGSGTIGGGSGGGGTPGGSSGSSGPPGALAPPEGSSGSGGGVGASGGPSGPPAGGGGGGGGALPPSGSSDEPPPEDDELSTLCSQEDRENLERFYETTTGEEPWDENENWNSEEPLNQWYGVETDEDGNVVSLRLSHNALSGDMPAREFLLCFSELKELALWGNDLSGEVPEDFVLAVERAVLRDIAEMLNINPEWFENYEDPYDFEDWHTGVTTDEKGRVVELDLTGEVPGTLISQLRKLRIITTSSENGGCALSPEDDSSAFSLFLLALLVFATLGRKRARD